jgi:hypothetical protein
MGPPRGPPAAVPLPVQLPPSDQRSRRRRWRSGRFVCRGSRGAAAVAAGRGDPVDGAAGGCGPQDGPPLRGCRGRAGSGSRRRRGATERRVHRFGGGGGAPSPRGWARRGMGAAGRAPPAHQGVAEEGQGHGAQGARDARPARCGGAGANHAPLRAGGVRFSFLRSRRSGRRRPHQRGRRHCHHRPGQQPETSPTTHVRPPRCYGPPEPSGDLAMRQ